MSEETKRNLQHLRDDARGWMRAVAARGKRGKVATSAPEEPHDDLVRIAWVTAVTFGGNNHIEAPVEVVNRPRASIRIRPYGTLATFDYSELTRLTIAAHAAAVRVEVTVGGFRQIELHLHARCREGDMPTSHPTIEAAIIEAQKWRWYECPVPVPATRGDQ